MNLMQWLELGSYTVTVIGLPFALYVYLAEQRKERDNEEDEEYQLLSDAYNNFLKVVLENPDLRLRTLEHVPNRTAEQLERMTIIFEMLISLFERAYIVAYRDAMTTEQRRRWSSWDDYMREWCRRGDFRQMLPQLLRGEDAEFSRYILNVAKEETHDALPA
jgi:hypothetical protein